MERYTDAKGRKKARASSVEAYKRLAEYEALGLTPQELKDCAHVLFMCAYGYEHRVQAVFRAQ